MRSTPGRRAAFLTLLLATALVSLRANASVIYDFTGTCGNGCTGMASATLTLLDSYTPGTVLTDADFVSLSYTSTSGSYSIPTDAALNLIGGGGSLPVTSGLVDTDIAMDWVGAGTAHVTMPAGGWASTFEPFGIIDGGSSYTWTLVPEPAAPVLLALGLAALALAGRRRAPATDPLRVRSR